MIATPVTVDRTLTSFVLIWLILIAATDTKIAEAPLQRPEVLFPVKRDGLMDSSRRLSGVPATFVSRLYKVPRMMHDV